MIIFLLSLIASFLGILLYFLTLGTWKYIVIGVIIAIVATVMIYCIKFIIEKDSQKQGHYIYNPDKKD